MCARNICGNILIVLTLMAFSLLIKACAEKEVMSAHNNQVSIRQLFLFYCPSSYKQNRKCSKHLPWPIFHSHSYLCRIFLLSLFSEQKCQYIFSLPFPMASCSVLFGLTWLISLFSSLVPLLSLLPPSFSLPCLLSANNYWVHDILDLES